MKFKCQYFSRQEIAYKAAQLRIPERGAASKEGYNREEGLWELYTYFIRTGGDNYVQFDFLSSCPAQLLSQFRPRVKYARTQLLHLHTQNQCSATMNNFIYKNCNLYIYIFIFCVCIYASGNVWSEDSLVQSVVSFHHVWRRPWGLEASAFIC